MTAHHIGTVFAIEGMPTPRKLVLLAVVWRAGDKCRAWPSITRLSLDTGLSDRAVRYALKALAEDGYITMHRAPGRGLTMHLGAAFGAGPPRHDMPRPRHLSAKTAARGAGRTNKELETNYATPAESPHETGDIAPTGGPAPGESWGEYRERGGR